ncbi:MAG TPA: acetyl ornithine aminotransferase family protein [Candidatus Eremiobacteraceae bacterium]|jgi:4-aminobutyrate aminotransferase|nr:acetyl ornithine aminotransferase family protein [Candidatus Eremiobacteraceae bacterium]
MIATETKSLNTTDTNVGTKSPKLPKLNMALPGPNAKRVVEEDAKWVSPSYTRDYPLVAKRGYGAMVEDVDGNVFLDFAAGIAVCSTGHCHPDVVAAVQKQAAELLHMSGTDFYYEGMPKLASKLSAIAPGKESKRVYFGNSGAEAVEAAIKLAKYHTRRDKIIAFEGAFHGRTMGALSLTASKSTQRKGFGTLISGVFHMPYPDTYRGMYGKGPETVAADCLGYLENELFKRRVDPEEVAGIFIEPIQGEGGYMPAPVEFLKGLQVICRKYGIMLVADEVQSGMGRTGKWWASDHAGIEPDIICTAKGIASGMPLSAVIARESVMNWKPGAHASTFGGNPVCIAASLATIELLESQYIQNAERVGNYIMKRTADWTQKFKNVGNVRGRGLMIGIELVKDQKTKEKAPELRNRIIDSAYHKGLLILGSGENTVRFCPPLVIDEEQAEFAVNTIEELLAKEEAK